MSIETNKITFLASRSMKDCLKDGWMLFALNFRQFLRFFSLPFLLASLIGAAGLLGVWHFAVSVAFPCHAYHVEGAPTEALAELVPTGLGDWASIVVGIVLIFVAFAAARAVVWVQVSSFVAEGGLPVSLKAIARPDLRRLFVRSLHFGAVQGIFLFLFLAAAVVIGHKTSPWWLLALGVAVFLVSVPLSAARLRYALTETTIPMSLKWSVGRGVPSLSRLAVIFVIVMLAASLLMLPAVLIVVLTTADMLTAEHLMLLGDTPIVPAYAWVVYFLSFFLFLLVSFCAMAVGIWPLALNYGALESRDNVPPVGN